MKEYFGVKFILCVTLNKRRQIRKHGDGNEEVPESIRSKSSRKNDESRQVYKEREKYRKERGD